MKLYTQLNFGGNCEEAFRFYEKELGGRITMMMKQSDVPGAPPNAGSAIVHARMDIGGTILIANDVPPDVFQPLRNVYLYFEVDSSEEAERVHAALSDGGKISIPMGPTFFCDPLQPGA